MLYLHTNFKENVKLWPDHILIKSCFYFYEVCESLSIFGNQKSGKTDIDYFIENGREFVEYLEAVFNEYKERFGSEHFIKPEISGLLLNSVKLYTRKQTILKDDLFLSFFSNHDRILNSNEEVSPIDSSKAYVYCLPEPLKFNTRIRENDPAL